MIAALRFAFAALVAVGEGLLWALLALRILGQGTRHLADGRKALGAGALTCPAGHEVDLAGFHECSACGFVSDEPGAALFCPNPYCEAPVAPYVTCECGRSVVNPAARVVP